MCVDAAAVDLQPGVLCLGRCYLCVAVQAAQATKLMLSSNAVVHGGGRQQHVQQTCTQNDGDAVQRHQRVKA